MPATTLTDEFIKSVKPTGGRQVEFPDAIVPGLSLRVSQTGSNAKATKSWTFRYRTTEGKQRRLKLGTFPATSLASARKKARETKGQVEEHGDPARQRQIDRAKAGSPEIATLTDLAEHYFEASKAGLHRPNAKSKRESTLTLERDHFYRLVVPKFGRLPVADVQRATFQKFLTEIVGTAPGAARICRNVVRQMYNFAIRNEITDKNPAQFSIVPRHLNRERVLTDRELSAVWKACSVSQSLNGLLLSPGMAMALQLAIVTLQRGNEVCGATAGEIDLETRVWNIPGNRTKNHRSHAVPLSDLAISLIKSAMALPRPDDDKPGYLFPSPKAGSPVSRHAFTRAMKRIVDLLKIENATPHDFRRTGSTHMTSERLGIPRFHVSCVLNHISDTGGAAAVTAVYDRNAYLPEKRRALDKWAARLLEIVGEKPEASNVVALR